MSPLLEPCPRDSTLIDDTSLGAIFLATISSRKLSRDGDLLGGRGGGGVFDRLGVWLSLMSAIPGLFCWRPRLLLSP